MGFRLKTTPLQPLIPPYRYAAYFCLNQLKQSVALPASSAAPGHAHTKKEESQPVEQLGIQADWCNPFQC